MIHTQWMQFVYFCCCCSFIRCDVKYYNRISSFSLKKYSSWARIAQKYFNITYLISFFFCVFGIFFFFFRWFCSVDRSIIQMENLCKMAQIFRLLYSSFPIRLARPGYYTHGDILMVLFVCSFVFYLFFFFFASHYHDAKLQCNSNSAYNFQ